MSDQKPPLDHVSAEDPLDGQSIEGNLKSKPTWLRLFFMAIVAILYGVSRVVLVAVVILQFFFVLLTAERNQGLLHLGASLATYTYQIVRYLTFNTEERPFPFDQDWPSEAPDLRTESPQ